ncbi:MAG: hypothetical protein MN733_22810 [Nitrososphaera sp.]|nr:hypothetical protein [Nitrososphaera sp.]
MKTYSHEIRFMIVSGLDHDFYQQEKALSAQQQELKRLLTADLLRWGDSGPPESYTCQNHNMDRNLRNKCLECDGRHITPIPFAELEAGDGRV